MFACRVLLGGGGASSPGSRKATHLIKKKSRFPATTKILIQVFFAVFLLKKKINKKKGVWQARSNAI